MRFFFANNSFMPTLRCMAQIGHFSVVIQLKISLKRNLKKTPNYTEEGMKRKQYVVKQAPDYFWFHEAKCALESVIKMLLLYSTGSVEGRGCKPLQHYSLFAFLFHRFFLFLRDSYTGTGISQQNFRHLYRSGCGHCEMLYWLFHLFSVLQ